MVLSVSLLATIFHMGAVAAFNAPDGSTIKTSVRPVLWHYAGPWLAQNWSLFAPKAPTYNTDVFVQGKTGAGVRTAWYDVSRYFNKSALGNPFFREHYLSEGLAHSADFLFSQRADNRKISEVIIRRLSATVLFRYVKKVKLTALRIEIDRRYIAPVPPEKARKHMVEDRVLPWAPIPMRIND